LSLVDGVEIVVASSFVVHNMEIIIASSSLIDGVKIIVASSILVFPLSATCHSPHQSLSSHDSLRRQPSMTLIIISQ
jgi:hypothetical protein